MRQAYVFKQVWFKMFADDSKIFKISFQCWPKYLFHQDINLNVENS